MSQIERALAGQGILTDGTAKRSCGECTLCCTVMGVPDLPAAPKPPGERCGHVCSRGCRIYQQRPPTCRDFACVWAQGGLPKHMRPDKVGMVFTVDSSGELLIGFWDLARPQLWLRTVRGYLLLLGAKGAPSVVGPPGDGKVARHFDQCGEHLRPASANLDTTNFIT